MGCCTKANGARTCCCSRVEWAMWGNINALYAGIFIFAGSVVAASIPEIKLDSQFPINAGSILRWVNIVIGLVVILVEYPRSARKVKKTNVERPGQKYLAPVLHNLRFFGRQYIIRFILYLVLMIPTMLVLSSIFGGICLFCACVCYFVAALNGESWKAPSLAWGPGSKKPEPKDAQGGKIIPDAPDKPPPRPPQQASPTDMGPPPSAPPPRPRPGVV